MARHRVIPFDDTRYFDLANSTNDGQRIIPNTDPKYPAIRRRLIQTFAQTILGYLAMGVLCFLALWTFGFSYHFTFGFGLLWLFLPVPMWWFCAKIAIAMTKSVPADPTNPKHKRVMDCVDRVFAQSGLKFKPPVYASPNPLPNAFATGPIHRKAVVAFTEGLLDIGLTDAEIEAVFAHELGHVRNYDVAINSFLGVLSSLFFLIVNAGLELVFGTLAFLGKFTGLARFIPKILKNVLFYGIFWFTSQITKLVQMFVVRSRESGADATGAYFTGDPCSLATALEKLVAYVSSHRPKPGMKEEVMYRALRPMMTIDPLYDTLAAEPKSGGIWSRIKGIWNYLMLTHPPASERIAQLERMNGGACPRV